MARAALTGSVRDPFLADLERLADVAARTAGSIEDHCFDVAGSIVRLRFAGAALVGTMTRALGHLRVPADAPPALSIRVWDTPDEPFPQLARAGETVRGSLHGDGSSDGDGASFFQRDAHALSVLDAERNEAYHHRVAGPDRAPAAVGDSAAPLSVLLRPWLAARDVQLVHAGAVGTAAGCVLLVGAAGAGKSHVALSSLCAGLGYIGDDTCLLGPDRRDPPSVFSIYSSAQPGRETLERLPQLAHTPSNPHRAADAKAVCFLAEHLPDSLLLKAPLRAIAILARGEHAGTSVNPASPAEAVRAAAPTSMLRLPGTARPTLERLAQVARNVPCHNVQAGSDPARLASVIAKLL